MSVIQQPITGKEDFSLLYEPMHSLVQFYAACNNRDLSLLSRNWDHAPEVVLDHPLGGIVRGWEEIERLYERFFSSPLRIDLALHEYTLYVTEDLFYVVGRELGTLSHDNRNMELSIRVSMVFRLVDNIWKQVHYHGSIDDPRLLKEYQDIIFTS